MEDLTDLRSRVYERDKYTSGWAAHGVVALAYVHGHTCHIPANASPPGQRLQTTRSDHTHNADFGWGNTCGWNHIGGWGNSDGSGHGNGNADGGDRGGRGCRGHGYGSGGQLWKT